jgi:methionine-rich copper-binding protein CopC
LIDVSWLRGTRTAGPPARPIIDTLRTGLYLRLVVVAGIGTIWACSGPTPAAQAHAIILESAPPQGSTGPAPKRLVLRFNSRLEKSLCSVQLVGPRQRSIALLRQEADAPPDTLTYPLPALEPGEYQARWKVMAADGHVTEGTVLFTVGAS